MVEEPVGGCGFLQLSFGWGRLRIYCRWLVACVDVTSCYILLLSYKMFEKRNATTWWFGDWEVKDRRIPTALQSAEICFLHNLVVWDLVFSPTQRRSLHAMECATVMGGAPCVRHMISCGPWCEVGRRPNFCATGSKKSGEWSETAVWPGRMTVSIQRWLVLTANLSKFYVGIPMHRQFIIKAYI